MANGHGEGYGGLRLMITNEPGNSPGTRSSVHVDFPFTEAPDRPTFGMGEFVESGIRSDMFGEAMPVVTVGLDNQSGLLKHKVRLEASKHRLMHLKLQTPLLELVVQEALDGSHCCREVLVQSVLAMFFSCFGTYRSVKVRLAHSLSVFRGGPLFAYSPGYSLSRLWGTFKSTVGLAAFLFRFRGVVVAKKGSLAKMGLTHLLPISRVLPSSKHRLMLLLSIFKGSLENTTRHSMFNYNISAMGGKP